MKTRYIYIMLLAITFSLFGCAKEYGVYPTTKLGLKIDLSTLALPVNTTVTYQNIVLSMNNASRWSELKQFKFAAITDEIETMSSTYSNVVLTADVRYQDSSGNLVTRPTQTRLEYADVFGDKVFVAFKLIDKK